MTTAERIENIYDDDFVAACRDRGVIIDQNMYCEFIESGIQDAWDFIDQKLNSDPDKPIKRLTRIRQFGDKSFYKLDGKGRDRAIGHRSDNLFSFHSVYYYGSASQAAEDDKVKRRIYYGKIISETDEEIIFQSMTLKEVRAEEKQLA